MMMICLTGNKEVRRNWRKAPRIFLRIIHGGEDGSIIVIVAIAMTVLLGITAMSVDVGLAYLRTGTLQTALDAAVYSAGRALPVEVSDTDAQNAIKDSAIAYASLNGYDNLTRSDVLLENAVLGYYTQIRISTNENVDLNFASVLGIYSINFSRSAAAKLSPIDRATGVTPLGVVESEMAEMLATGDLTDIVLKYGISSGVGPFFGALDLDGGGGGAKDYRLWLSNGYEGEICVGDILLEETGAMTGPTYAGFSARYDACTHYDALSGGEGCTAEHYDPYCSRIIKVVIYAINENHTIEVRGFAAFLLESQTDDGYITGTFLTMLSDGVCSGESLTEETFYSLSGLMLIE